ncbi:MAG: hypothetical protein M3R51_07215 [Candidatus Eremiobacteraeota bacterium]|nr:hypothetical protein [Candidatus Eremiobacteraeota bacterium]
MRAPAGEIPTIGGHKPPGYTASGATPSDVVHTLREIINGISNTSDTSQIASASHNPRFCAWEDIERTLRRMADEIHDHAEKSDAWHWSRDHRACISQTKHD